MPNNTPIETIVEEILKEGTFYSEYQPIVALDNDETVGYEALARFWFREEMLPPYSLFGKLHSHLDLLDRLELSVKSFQIQHCPADSLLFLNFDSHLLPTKYDTLDRLMNDQSHHTALVFEAVESSSLINPSLRNELFSKVKELNLQIAIGDFGKPNGFFSMGLVNECDIVKIDLAWFNLSKNNPEHFEFIQAFVKFVHSLDKAVILEGVETADDKQLANRLDVDYVQGYLYTDRFIIVDP